MGLLDKGSLRFPSVDEIPPLNIEPSGGTRGMMCWIGGAVLICVLAMCFVSVALLAPFEGAVTMAAVESASVDPHFVGHSELSRGSAWRRGVNSKVSKGDRMRSAAGTIKSRQVLHLSTLTVDGDKSVIKVQPFVRVIVPLSLRKTSISAKIPPFKQGISVYGAKAVGKHDGTSNSTSSTSRRSALYGAVVDGEVMLRSADLPVGEKALFDPEVNTSTSEVEYLVRKQALLLADGSVSSRSPTGHDENPNRGLIRNTSYDKNGTNLAMRVAAANVSYLVKNRADVVGAQAGNGLDERLIEVGRGDDLKSILMEYNAGKLAVKRIANLVSKVLGKSRVKKLRRLRLGLASIDKSDLLKPVRVTLYGDAEHMLTLALSDEGQFVVAQEPYFSESMNASDAGDALVEDSEDVLTVYESLYQTALENKVPVSIIEDLVKLYALDLDLTARVRRRDALELFYSLDDMQPRSSVLYTSLTIKGRKKRFYRYVSSSGNVAYLDEEGKSGRRFLIRKPINNARLSSGFGGRKHPLLGYYRMHTGVDWAAVSGTPVFASGDGVVEFLGWKGGYGRFLKISHGKGYSSGYGHLSAFAKGLENGMKVRQGQIVAYVGSTGLSTGPHLHYEVYVNNVAVDPMAVKLPRARELKGTELATFEQEKGRMDAIMNKPYHATMGISTKSIVSIGSK